MFNNNLYLKWPRYDIIPTLQADSSAGWANTFHYCDHTGRMQDGTCDYDPEKFWIVIRKCLQRSDVGGQNFVTEFILLMR